jgi:hypothetical protein
MIKFRKRNLLALALTATALLVGTSMPASAATGEDGFPILSASHADGAHKCAVVGKYGAYQGVVCADIITSEVNGSDYYAYGQIEVICQHIVGSTATDVQCAQVDAYGEMSSAQSGAVQAGGELLCGHQYGWIELPVVAKNIYLEAGSGANDGSNFSTGHYYVCA